MSLGLKKAIEKEKLWLAEHAKQDIGDHVTFWCGGRKMSGWIIGRRRQLGDDITYEIRRNKQVFHFVNERDILDIPQQRFL